MYKIYDILENVLNDIENEIKQNINTEILAKRYSLSSTHLRRLFILSFGQSLGSYIRSRKIAASIEGLLNTNESIMNVSAEYGYDYEQTYVRTFKREFGITPGDLRKTRQIIKINPPLLLFNSNKVADGIFFGPEIVFIPQFHVIGKLHKMTFRDVYSLPKLFIKDFTEQEKQHITNTLNSDVLILISKYDSKNKNHCYSMPSVQVKSLDNIPEDFDYYTFPNSLCARFFIIVPYDTELNKIVADEMYKAIDDFMDDEHQNYFLDRKKVSIDRFDTITLGNEKFKHWEWFAPVIKKSKNDISPVKQGIIKTYKKEIPVMRFIGKKYAYSPDEFDSNNIIKGIENCFMNYQFEEIVKHSYNNLENALEDYNSYIFLTRKTENNFIEYYLGVFLPKDSITPEGYEVIDFPESVLGICTVYGKKIKLTNFDIPCRNKLYLEGITKKTIDNSNWYFISFNWQKFLIEDRYGNRLVDYCYFL